MTITKRNYDLEKGTVLIHNACGFIKLTSEYDNINCGYAYIEMECDDDGNLVETEKTGFATASDLVGDEIC